MDIIQAQILKERNFFLFIWGRFLFFAERKWSQLQLIHRTKFLEPNGEALVLYGLKQLLLNV